MNLKNIFVIISVIVGLLSFYPYFRDIFNRNTQPHAYTWLIQLITQGTAAAGIWYGGGGLGALELTLATLLILWVFILSLRFGSKNITRFDTVILIASLSAIGIWITLKNPILAILMISVIDVLSYIPSLRKSFTEPWGETIITWAGFAIGNCFAIAALKNYNFLTLCYLISINIANISLVLLCFIRRHSILNPDKFP